MYENNKSASQAIKEQISKELSVELMYINSALVSAQNRQRFYAFDWSVEQPTDRNIHIFDIIEKQSDEMDLKQFCRFYVDDISIKNKPIRIGTIGKGGQGERVYSIKGKSVTLSAQGGGRGAKTGLYNIENVVRKLTVTEACRLQTLPDDYCKAVSKSQAYKGLGNGWTAEVIIHILNGALANMLTATKKIVVLSMYDGIGTGRYCLDKMGFKNVEYYAFEIDKFAMQIANNNYPNIIQCGDAFQMRDYNFLLGGLLNDL